MKILKFGSASLSNREQLAKVAQIINQAAKSELVITVVSALRGMYQQLLEIVEQAKAKGTAYQESLQKFVDAHLQALPENNKATEVVQAIQQLATELHDILHGINLLHDSSPRTLDLVVSFGERLSALILSAHLRTIAAPAYYADARQFIITDEHFGNANVLYDLTQAAIAKYFKELYKEQGAKTIPVVSGCIGSTEAGHTTTIGRNGADYSAAIIGATLKANAIEIWTDVDGVYSADPRTVPTAFVLPQLSCEEALELSYFGAKVLHTTAVAPAIAKNIPIYIKNSFNPSAPGTLIDRKVQAWEGAVKGITAVDDIALITLRGLSMVGVPGTAERFFRALAKSNINIILISQASSEHTICCAIAAADLQKARLAVQQEFAYEFSEQLTGLEEKTAQTIITIVGEGMKGTPGVAGKLFQALGRHQININAIAQGASERNISAVIDTQQRNRALNVVHQGFFEKLKHLALIVIGAGNIGTTLLRQLQQQREFLLKKGFDVQICGIANSKQLVFNEQGLDLNEWQSQLQNTKQAFQVSTLLELVSKSQFTNIAMVDCTASSDLIKVYPEFVKANMHIITPNKKANVLPWENYQALLQLLQSKQKYFLYEANVGAGLPIISTLQDLIAGGDSIIKIEGIFSGTLSYLFNHFDGTSSFSALVKKANELGYTEPDPREDLSGMDVARKLLILARQLGWKMELSDIEIENLVPEKLTKDNFTPDFYQRYAEYDAVMQKRAQEAKSRNAVLRYVGVLHEGKAYAKLLEVSNAHPLANTKGSDNIIAFTTARYNNTPLVVQGPGAGAEVTAMGVFSDILKLLNYLPN